MALEQSDKFPHVFTVICQGEWWVSFCQPHPGPATQQLPVHHLHFVVRSSELRNLFSSESQKGFGTGLLLNGIWLSIDAFYRVLLLELRVVSFLAEPQASALGDA